MPAVVEMAATPARVVTAAKCTGAHGEGERILLAIGDDVASARWFVITTSTARRLRRLLDQALTDPPPPRGSRVVRRWPNL